MPYAVYIIIFFKDASCNTKKTVLSFYLGVALCLSLSASTFSFRFKSLFKAQKLDVASLCCRFCFKHLICVTETIAYPRLLEHSKHRRGLCECVFAWWKLCEIRKWLCRANATVGGGRRRICHNQLLANTNIPELLFSRNYSHFSFNHLMHAFRNLTTYFTEWNNACLSRECWFNRIRASHFTCKPPVRSERSFLWIGSRYAVAIPTIYCTPVTYMLILTWEQRRHRALDALF